MKNFVFRFSMSGLIAASLFPVFRPLDEKLCGRSGACCHHMLQLFMNAGAAHAHFPLLFLRNTPGSKLLDQITQFFRIQERDFAAGKLHQPLIGKIIQHFCHYFPCASQVPCDFFMGDAQNLGLLNYALLP